jgi:tetratricopeptide (TPR) repeat protein
MREYLNLFRLWALFLSLATLGMAHAQSNVLAMRQALSKLPDDSSKIKMLIGLSESVKEINIKQSETYAADALAISKQMNQPEWIVKSLVQLGWVKGQSGGFSDAIGHLDEADAIIQDAKLFNLGPEVLMARGRVSYEKHYIPEALEYWMTALRQFENLGDSNKVANVLSQIGGLHFFAGNLDNAESFLKRAEKLSRSLPDSILLAQVLTNRGNCYAVNGDMPSSNQIILEAIEINKRLESYGGLAKCFTNLAMNYYETERYDSALYHFKEALRFDSLWENPVGILYSKINVAAALRKVSRTQEALSLAKNALESAESLGDLHLQKTILEDIAEIYNDLGNPQQALTYYIQFNALKDSMFNMENTRIVADMQAKYEVEKKEKTVLLLEAKQKQDRLLIFGFLGLALMLGLLGIMQYRLHKARIAEAAQKLKLQEQQLSAFAAGLVEKDEWIAEVSAELESLKENKSQQKIDHLDALLKSRLSTQDDWLQFQNQFEHIYPGFFAKLQSRFPSLTPTEIKICALEKVGLKDSQAGDLLGVNPESIRKGRYRLRKGMGEEGWEALRQFLLQA